MSSAQLNAFITCSCAGEAVRKIKPVDEWRISAIKAKDNVAFYPEYDLIIIEFIK